MNLTFFGHRDTEITEQLEKDFLQAISPYLSEPLVCYLGGYGAFDYFCAKTLRALKEKHQQIKTIFVTPYLNDGNREKLKAIEESQLYDEIIYPPIENVPKRLAILRRNEYMVNCSDGVICYIARGFGGAPKAVAYAKKKGKFILNLSTYQV